MLLLFYCIFRVRVRGIVALSCLLLAFVVCRCRIRRLRQHNPRQNFSGLRGCDGKAALLTVKKPQPLRHIANAHAAALRPGGTCRTLQRILDARPAVRCHFSVVLDLKEKSAIFLRNCAQAKFAAAPRQIVLDRVLNDRLEHQARDAHRKHRLVDLAPECQPVAQPLLCNVQIGIDILQFLCKRDLRTPVAADSCIKHG